jgi:uncharacterized protein YcbK (DUF882 family)
VAQDPSAYRPGRIFWDQSIMSSSFAMRRAAALCLVAACTPALAESDGGVGPLAFARTASLADPPSATAAAAPTAASARDGRVVEGNVFRLSRTNAGGVARQTGSVATGCLKPDLMAVLRRASNDFGSEAVVTSGFRRGRGYHAKCMAADVQIAAMHFA